MIKISNFNFTIFALNDFSTDNTKEFLENGVQEISDLHKSNIKTFIINNTSNLGFSKSIQATIDFAQMNRIHLNKILIVAGNDQINSTELFKLINSCDISYNIIGFRVNKLQTRPFAKYLSSNLFSKSVKFLIFPNIPDVNGTYFIDFDLMLKSIQESRGHSWPLHVLKNLVITKADCLFIPISLKSDIKTRKKRVGIRKIPKLRDALTLIIETIRVFYILEYKLKIEYRMRVINSPQKYPII